MFVFHNIPHVNLRYLINIGKLNQLGPLFLLSVSEVEFLLDQQVELHGEVGHGAEQLVTRHLTSHYSPLYHTSLPSRKIPKCTTIHIQIFDVKRNTCYQERN
jgi:hypothetical protein